MKTKKKLLFLCLAALLFMYTGFQAAATGKPEVVKPDVEPAAAEFADGEILPMTYANRPNIVNLPIVKESITLKVTTYTNTTFKVADPNDALNMKELEKRTNIHIDWERMPYKEYDAFIKAKFASGRNLPDIALCWDKMANIAYGMEGLILPVDDLILKYAPNLKIFLDGRPDLRKLMTAPDGHIYYIATMADPQVNFNLMYLRKAWMDRLNLDKPTTIDEWLEVFKAFKENDPNGNGKRDEYPYFPMPGPWIYLAKYGAFACAWQLKLGYGEGWDVDKNGKVFCEWTTPRAKEYLTFLKKLYEEEYIPKAVFDDPDGAKEKRNEYWEKAGADKSWSYRSKDKANPDEWLICDPPTAGYGDPVLETFSPVSSWAYVITKDCKDPAAAIKWIDYWFCSKDGYNLVFNGNVGEPDTDSMGNPKRPPKEKWTDLYMIWDINIQTHDQYYVNENLAHPQHQQAVLKYGKLAQPPLTATLPTPEELEVIQEYKSDFYKYIDEMIVNFVTGKESLDNWDSFVNQLNKYGLENLRNVVQGQYDRSISF
jgi:putative aldouronate transport system substrate-binding protein